MQKETEILITGGTGFLGSYLLDYLIEQGQAPESITVFDLQDKIEERKTHLPDVKFSAGDIRDKEEVNEVVKGKDVIFHLAAVVDEQSDLLEEVNVGGTANLLRAITDLAQDNRPKLVHVSTVGVMGETEGEVNESAAYNPRTRYEETKAEAEKMVLDFCQSEHLPAVVVRPAMIYGPNRYWKQIVNKAREQFPLIGNGNNHWHLLYIRNAVAGLYLAADRGQSGEIYLLADEEVKTYRQIYQMLADEMEVAMPSKQIPVWLAKLVAFFAELKGKLTDEKPIVTRSHIKRLVRERNYSIQKAQSELDYQPPYSIQEGLAELVMGLESQQEK